MFTQQTLCTLNGGKSSEMQTSENILCGVLRSFHHGNTHSHKLALFRCVQSWFSTAKAPKSSCKRAELGFWEVLLRGKWGGGLESTTRRYTKGVNTLRVQNYRIPWDIEGFYLKHFHFSSNVSYTEELENVQPHKHLNVPKATIKQKISGKHLTIKRHGWKTQNLASAKL